MNWEAVGAVAELIGAGGVVSSLLYLAVQMKQSSNATKAQSVQAVQQSMIDIALASADESWADVFEQVPETFEGLPYASKVRLGWLWFAVMRGTETLYHHYLRGNADQSVWETYEGSIAVNLSNNVFREWWRANTYPFTQEFTEYVEAKMRDVEAEGREYRWFANNPPPATKPRT